MLIAISGKMGSGKDTLAQIILNYFQKKGVKCKYLKFADTVKKSSALITQTTVEDNYNNKDKIIPNLDMSIGRFQQLFGTAMRHIHTDIWVYPVIQEYLADVTNVCVISDCRFKNEAKIIKEHGGLIFRINRSDENEMNKTRDANHISEIDMDDYCDYDLVIQNDYTMEYLEKHIHGFLPFCEMKV